MSPNFRPLATKCWENFLSSNGFTQTRVKGSHFHWVKKGKRTIPVWGSKKEIPAFHLRTGCTTIGFTLNDLYEWADKNC